MLYSYATLALRTLRKNKLFSLINVGGLTLGLAIFLFTNILAGYERGYDRFFEKSDRIYMPTIHFVPGGPISMRTAPFVPTAVATHMTELTGVEQVVRGLDRPFIAQVGDRTFFQNIRFFDDGFFNIFELEFVKGAPEDVFRDASSLVISEKAAEKYFGQSDPINKIITLDGKQDMRVAAVFRSLPENSHFSNSFIVDSAFEMGGSMAAYSQMTGFDPAGDWEEIDPKNMTYVLLEEGVAPESLNLALDRLRLEHAPEDIHELIGKITLVHVSKFNTFIEDALGIPVYAVMQVIGFLILVIAILNYSNLATAQALGRAREVGIRKTFGAGKKNLFAQFMVEAIGPILIAAILSVGILKIVLPLLNGALNRNIAFDVFTDPGAASFYLGVVFLTWLVAGAFPSAVLARMNIVQVLSGSMGFGKMTYRMRNIMIGIQFVFAVVLTTTVFVINAQNNMVNEAAKLFDRDHIVNLYQIRPDMMLSYDALVNQLKTIPGVLHVSGENTVPFEGGQEVRDMATTRGKEDRIQTNFYYVDEDFMDLFNVPVIAGRDLMRGRGDMVEEWEKGEEAPATINVLINELAVTKLGFNSPEEAIGKTIFQILSDPDPSTYVIVGVVENRNLVGLWGGLTPSLFELRPAFFTKVSIRTTNADTGTTVASIEEAWTRVYPDYPITRNFLDDQITQGAALFEGISKAISALAIMAVALAGMGLFGLAAFMANMRTKEIGLRKVLGASIPAIVRMLLWQFSKPVAIAILLGLPLAWGASQFYLDFFAERVTLTPWIFLASGALILGFAWVTVAAHAIRVARANPIHALRTE